LLGDVRLSRAYYHCQSCKHGLHPWDQTLRLSPQRLTPGAQEVIALEGIQASFGQVADRLLHKLTGLRMSESTVERTTEAAGKRLGEKLAAGETFGEAKPWGWNRDAAGQTCGYVSVDATGIMMQGPDGAKADGRMVYVGMVYNPKPRSEKDEDTKPCENVRYLAGLMSLADVGGQMRRQAAQVGMNDVEQWVALSDAGSGLDNFFNVYFPRAAKVADFWHATEYLAPLSKAIQPGAAGEKLMSDWCHQLKHEGGSALLTTLESLDREKMTKEGRNALDKALTYFRNNCDRMKYPEYLAKGWQIGSGSVESACKNVINRRLSMGGMRWGEEGGDSVSHLRALFCSETGQWDAFWYLAT
jgi:hypothetical protein